MDFLSKIASLSRPNFHKKVLQDETKTTTGARNERFGGCGEKCRGKFKKIEMSHEQDIDQNRMEGWKALGGLRRDLQEKW